MAKKNKLGYFNPASAKLIDADYLETLSHDELKWYIRFCQEYYDQKFSKDINERIDKRETAYKESYTRDNAARRDVMHQWYKISGEYLESDVLRCPIKKPKKLSSKQITNRMFKTLTKLKLAA